MLRPAFRATFRALVSVYPFFKLLLVCWLGPLPPQLQSQLLGLAEVNERARARSHIVLHLQIIYCYFYWTEQRESFLLSLMRFDASTAVAANERLY